MSQTDSATKSDWVRLNVGGTVFQTTKDTLSRHAESYLARLVSGELTGEKDESGAYLIDGDPEHFRTILTYLRSNGTVLHLDGNEQTSKDLLSEAAKYGIGALVEEIRRALRPPHTEIVLVKNFPLIPTKNFGLQQTHIGYIQMSETRQDYDVLTALSEKVKLQSYAVPPVPPYYIVRDEMNDEAKNEAAWMNIEATLRNLGFVKEELSKSGPLGANIQKFVRTVRQ